jgi:hypothetical protein
VTHYKTFRTLPFAKQHFIVDFIRLLTVSQKEERVGGSKNDCRLLSFKTAFSFGTDGTAPIGPRARAAAALTFGL